MGFGLIVNVFTNGILPACVGAGQRGVTAGGFSLGRIAQVPFTEMTLPRVNGVCRTAIIHS